MLGGLSVIVTWYLSLNSQQGPFVHLSSIIALQMSKLITNVNRVYAVSLTAQNEFIDLLQMFTQQSRSINVC